jgi:hypothetical protein
MKNLVLDKRNQPRQKNKEKKYIKKATQPAGGQEKHADKIQFFPSTGSGWFRHTFRSYQASKTLAT